MNNFRFYAPTEVVFGKDAENDLGETAKKYGKKRFLCMEKEALLKAVC